MKVLCCGDRDWKRKDIIKRELKKLPKGTTIIEGECRGADLLSLAVAIELGFEIMRFPAQWEVYGRAAGVLRNQQMLDEGKPDLVLAFHSSIERSRGTRDMIQREKQQKIPVQLIKE